MSELDQAQFGELQLVTGARGMFRVPLVTVQGVTSAASVELVAAPAAGKQIAIVYIHLARENAATVATLVSGAQTVRRRNLVNAGDTYTFQAQPGQELLCPAAMALTLNLSVGSAVGYNLDYYLVDED